jgi:prophage regulatory protein
MSHLKRLLVCKKGLRELGVPYSFQHIARLEKAGVFPQRIRLSANRVAWDYEEVCAWIAERSLLRDRQDA